MKAIINGLRYDTAKAKLVGQASEGSANDFNHWQAGLYRTPRSGRFFLAGSGGPMSRFSRAADGGGWIGSERLMPMDPEDALAWAEAHLSAAEVEAAFADQIEEA